MGGVKDELIPWRAENPVQGDGQLDYQLGPRWPFTECRNQLVTDLLAKAARASSSSFDVGRPFDSAKNRELPGVRATGSGILVQWSMGKSGEGQANRSLCPPIDLKLSRRRGRNFRTRDPRHSRSAEFQFSLRPRRWLVALSKQFGTGFVAFDKFIQPQFLSISSTMDSSFSKPPRRKNPLVWFLLTDRDYVRETWRDKNSFTRHREGLSAIFSR